MTGDDDTLGPVTDTSPSDPTKPAIHSTVAATWALFSGLLLLMLGIGLQGTLVGIRSEREGFDTLAIGVVMASYYAGYLVGSRATFELLGRVGHIRVFAAFASTASVAVLLHSVWINPVTWTLMRFVTGFCMAGLYMVSESWLNDRATNATRGLIMSAYMVVAMGGKAGGQVLLNFGDPSSFQLFILASALVSMSLVPMALSTSSTPPVVKPQRVTFAEMRALVPTGLLSTFVAGLAAGTIGGLAAVYATRVDMTTGEISIYIGAVLAGAVVFQIPIGVASDHLPRRKVMLATMLIGTALAVVAALGPEKGWLTVAIFFGIGGVSYPLYSLAIAYSNDWIPNERRAGAAMVLVTINGLGATIGPIIGSVTMRDSPAGFYWTLAVIYGSLAVYLAMRIVVRAPVPVNRQSRFAPFPERASAVLYSIGRTGRRAVEMTIPHAHWHPPPGEAGVPPGDDQVSLDDGD